MRNIWVLGLIVLVGCSRPEATTEGRAAPKGVASEETLINLIGNDPNKDLVAHPLICDEKGDVPKGRELIFLQRGTKKVVHAVFPDKTTSPKDLTGLFELKGHYRGIQKKARFKQHRMELIDNYRYFVVSTWKKQKLEQDGSAPSSTGQ